ncbi:MAG: hypothetical protein ACI4SG_02640 [Oligosphaeraceae bacterium]
MSAPASESFPGAAAGGPCREDSLPWLLVADAHVTEGSPSLSRFQAMLSTLEQWECPLVFLGDIMELWIGLPGFQTPAQAAFLAWCEKESRRRRLLFLEGNHEFFVVSEHGASFSGAGGDFLREDGVYLTHGDQIAATPSHLWFRRWSKGRLARLLLRFLPFSRSIVRLIKSQLEKRGRKRSRFFPSQAIVAWGGTAKEGETVPPRALLMGHFHRPFQHRFPDGTLLAALPAWKDHGDVALYFPRQNRLLFRNWRDLSPHLPKPDGKSQPTPTPKSKYGQEHSAP